MTWRRAGEFENTEVPKNDGFWEKFALASDKEKVDARIRTCKMCAHMNEWNICQKCNCWMPLKIKFEGALCPLQKWNEIPNPEAGIATDGSNMRINSFDSIKAAAPAPPPVEERIAELEEIIKKLQDGGNS
jgi:hypothetical protein